MGACCEESVGDWLAGRKGRGVGEPRLDEVDQGGAEEQHGKGPYTKGCGEAVGVEKEG